MGILESIQDALPVQPACGDPMRKQRIGHLMTLWLVIGGVLSGCATFEKCGFTGCPGDAEITAEVKALYAEHPELGTSITVQTLDHVVYLYGLVNTEYSGEDDRSFRLNVTDYSG